MSMQALSLTVSTSTGASLGLKARRPARKVGKALELLPTIGEDTLLIFAAFVVEEAASTTPSSLECWPASLVDPLSLIDDAANSQAVTDLVKQSSQKDRKVISTWLTGTMSRLAQSEHGSRVIQAALHAATGADRASLSKEFQGSVLALCKCSHGHAVLNTFVEIMPAAATAFVVEEMKGHLVDIAGDRNGCYVLQTLIMHGNAAQVNTLAVELRPETARLCRHEHGSLVVQCLLEYGNARCREDVVEHMLPFLALFAMHKIASHVVEKVVGLCGSENMQRVVSALVNSAEFSVADIACSRCGSALLRELADDVDHLNEFRLPLWKAGARLDKSKYGRKVMSTFGLPHMSSSGQDWQMLHVAAAAA